MNMTALLLAISMVESRHDANAIGAAGEISNYQITEGVWRQHSRLPFVNKHQPWVFDAVATKHIRWINGQLPKELHDDPFWIAVAWNGGMGAVYDAKANGEYRKGNVKRRVQDYADKVRAWYFKYKKNIETSGVKRIRELAK